MKTGVLLYCFDTPFVEYSRITVRCLDLLYKNLGLPIRVITDSDI